MITTFSVNNNNQYNTRVCRLLAQLDQGKKYLPETLSDMYIKAVEGEEIKDISAYSKQVEKFAALKRSKDITVPILTEDEVMVYKGITEVNLPAVEVDDIDYILDKPVLIHRFIDIRENLYYTLGVDIYRLLELIEQGDYKAKTKLDAVVQEYPALKDFLYEILTTPHTFSTLQDILA